MIVLNTKYGPIDLKCRSRRSQLVPEKLSVLKTFQQTLTKKWVLFNPKDGQCATKTGTPKDNLAICQTTARKTHEYEAVCTSDNSLTPPECFSRAAVATSRAKIHLFGEHWHNTRDLFLCVEARRVWHRLKLYCHLVVDTGHDVLELQFHPVFADHVTQWLDEPGSAHSVSPWVVACRQRSGRAKRESGDFFFFKGKHKAHNVTLFLHVDLVLWRRRKRSRLPQGSWWIEHRQCCRFPRLHPDQCLGMPAQRGTSSVKAIDTSLPFIE